MSDTEIDGPREGEGIWDWIHRKQAEHLAEAMEATNAYVQELSDWNEAHPDATAAEREAAFEQIKQKYPRQVEYDKKTEAWANWKLEHLRASLDEKEAGFEEIWGFEADEDEWEDDPEFWEWDPDDPLDARNAR